MIVSRKDIPTTHLVEYPAATRFIKLPIENYLSLMKPAIEPIEPQIALINAINNPDYRFITAVLSRRTGKTFISNIIGQLVVLVPGTQILIIAPNYSLSSISWDLQNNLIKMFGIETVRKNAKDKVLELTNGSIIRIGSVPQVDSCVGRSYDLIIFDEAALNDKGKEAYNVALRPTLDKDNSKCIFISTPRGKNWFHEFYLRGFSEGDDFSKWASILATYESNPRASAADINDARASMSKAEFAQEYMCNFNVMQGQIYELKPSNIVDIDVSDILDGVIGIDGSRKVAVQDVFAGLDIGFRDDTAFITMVTDGKNVYIIDEYIENERTTASHAAEIGTRIDNYLVDFNYIDSAAQQTKFDLAMNYNISCINAKKSVLDGIGYVASLVDNNRIFVDKKCVQTLNMFENYHWDMREGLTKEKPVHDVHSHPADAIRYGIYTHSYNLEMFDDFAYEDPKNKETA